MAKKYVNNPVNISLYYTSRLLHLYPLNFDFHRRDKFKTKHQLSLFFVVVLITSMFAWNYKMKYTLFYKHGNTSYSVIDVAINLALTVFNISSIMIVQLSSKEWEIFFVPVFKKVKNNYGKTNYMFYFVHIIQVVWFFIEIYICRALNFSMLAPLFLSLIDKINIYVVQISALLINGYVTCMKENIVSIKLRLQQAAVLLRKLKAVEKNRNAVLEKFLLLSEVDDVLNFIVEILKGLDAFNNIYGIQILGLSGIIMMFITNMCSSVLVLDTFLVGLICMKCYSSVILLVCIFRSRIYFLIHIRIDIIKTYSVSLFSV